MESRNWMTNWLQFAEQTRVTLCVPLEWLNICQSLTQTHSYLEFTGCEIFIPCDKLVSENAVSSATNPSLNSLGSDFTFIPNYFSPGNSWVALSDVRPDVVFDKIAISKVKHSTMPHIDNVQCMRSLTLKRLSRWKKRRKNVHFFRVNFSLKKKQRKESRYTLTVGLALKQKQNKMQPKKRRFT